jgi:hypothetical protein
MGFGHVAHLARVPVPLCGIVPMFSVLAGFFLGFLKCFWARLGC